jgi:prevent-host-death family protein
MNFITIRELKAEGSQVTKRLADKGDLVVTNHGKPVAMMVPVGEAELEELSQEIKVMRARLAWGRISAAAAARGLTSMSMKAIDKEIAAARKERHAKAARAARRS